jgi:hypothetical protein
VVVALHGEESRQHAAKGRPIARQARPAAPHQVVVSSATARQIFTSQTKTKQRLLLTFCFFVLFFLPWSQAVDNLISEHSHKRVVFQMILKRKAQCEQLPHDNTKRIHINPLITQIVPFSLDVKQQKHPSLCFYAIASGASQMQFWPTVTRCDNTVAIPRSATFAIKPNPTVICCTCKLLHNLT